MADTQKYYWLKLKDDFFYDKRIKKLIKLCGDTGVTVYLKMMLMAISNGGIIEFDGLEDNFYEELALQLDKDDEVVKEVLITLEKCNLIETENEKTYFLPQAIECTGSESASAVKMRRSRENRANQTEGHNVTKCDPTVTKCDPEKEIEKEKDIDIDIEIEIEKELYIEKDEEDAAKAANHRLRMNNGKYFFVFNNDVEQWTRLYPSVNVPQELRSMSGWLEANPEKRKAENEMPRFINSWLTRKQEDADKKAKTPVSINAKKPYTPDPTASYDLERAQIKMNTTVPKLKPKNKPCR